MELLFSFGFCWRGYGTDTDTEIRYWFRFPIPIPNFGWTLKTAKPMPLLLLDRHCPMNVLFLKIQPRQLLGCLTPRGGPAPYFELAVRKWTTFNPTVTTLLSNNRDHEKTNITEETLRAIHKNPWLDTAWTGAVGQSRKWKRKIYVYHERFIAAYSLFG